jgi:hypothetical protein
VIDSPHGDGAVCQIGDYWFYFWNSQDFSPAEENAEISAEELTSRYSVDTIIHEIWAGLERCKRELEFADEYDYYECVLKEGLQNRKP